MTDDSFEERLSIKLSRLNIFAFSGFVVLFCFFAAILILTTTSLKEYVPGKASAEVQQELAELTIRSDSLLSVLGSKDIYMKNIRDIITGENLAYQKANDSTNDIVSKISFERSIEDSFLRIEVESEDRGGIRKSSNRNSEALVFYTPVLGVITDKFNTNEMHFGVDLVAKEKAKISVVLEGTIIINHWTSETGYVVGVQHKNNYVSIYKHNSVLLKSVGDFVNVGEPIAIIGNSGEWSSGPHLHFELWNDGVPVDPENYIVF
jgi:murein DD-endopeptidase MepM/ murein hydrolase activator NlpD